jgi:putative transposase
MNLGCRRIKGWAMSDRLTKGLALNALKMAICNHPETAGAIHHSDRGNQNASTD